MNGKYIQDLYWYYRRLIIFKDLFDPKEDEYTIEQLAISAVCAELDIPRETVVKAIRSA